MKYYKSENGITMMTLVITIIILLIVSSTMIYSGVNTYQSMIKQNFLAEMQLLQAEVNKFADAYIEKADNLGLPIDSFKRVYYNEYNSASLTNPGSFELFNYEEQQKYLEFYEFVNNYNGFSNKFDITSLEKLVVTKKNKTGGTEAPTNMFFIPPIGVRNGVETTVGSSASEIAKGNGHTDDTGMGVLENVLDTVWLQVLNSDGSQFLSIPAGGNINDAIEISQKNYFYFTREMASAFFNMDVSTDLVIDFDDRYVISVSKSIEDDNNIYHTEYTLQGGDKTVDHKLDLPKKDIKLDFSYKVEFEQDNKRYKITIFPNEDNTMAIKSMYYYAGYTQEDNVTTPAGHAYLGINGEPELSPNKSWNLIDGSSFYTSESEAFGVKIVDVNGNVAYRVIKVKYINVPEIGKLIPIIKGEEDEWKIPESTDQWYDYENGMWANAMIDDIANYKGNTVTQTGSTFVWIPRFAYRILYFDSVEKKNAYKQNGDVTNIACYSDSRGLVKINGNPMVYEEFLTNKYAENYIVEVEFLNGTTNNDSAGIDVTTPYGGYYRVHPAFFDNIKNKEISGFWVSKNKITKTDAKDPKTNTMIDVVLSVDYQAQTKSSATDLFMSAYLMRNNFNLKEVVYTEEELKNDIVNTHMIKNLEYGAIVILTAGLMDGKTIDTSKTNTNNEYGLNDLFTNDQTYIATITRNYWNSSFNSNVREYILEARRKGYITEEQKVHLENNHANYLELLNSGNTIPEVRYGDGICEFAYKTGVDRFELNFLGQKNTLNDGTRKKADYILSRGLSTSNEVFSIIAANYKDNLSVNAATRAVLICE